MNNNFIVLFLIFPILVRLQRPNSTIIKAGNSVVFERFRLKVKERSETHYFNYSFKVYTPPEFQLLR